MTPPGDSLLSITAAGSMPDIGHGYQVRFMFVPSTPRRWSPGLVARAWELGSRSEMPMAGAPWAMENRLFPGMAEAVTISVT